MNIAKGQLCFRLLADMAWQNVSVYKLYDKENRKFCHCCFEGLSLGGALLK